MQRRTLKLNKLKSENAYLRSQRNVLKTQLKKEAVEEAKQQRDARPKRDFEQEFERDLNSDHPIHRAWIASNNKMTDNTNPGDYLADLDERMMQMIIEASVQEAGVDPHQDDEEKRLLELAIQESMKENPNPDLMNYEQLQELGDKIGVVKKGYSSYQIDRLRPKKNFEYREECPICIEKMEIACLVKVLRCKHVFHADCIDRSLENSKKCPC